MRQKHTVTTRQLGCVLYQEIMRHFLSVKIFRRLWWMENNIT